MTETSGDDGGAKLGEAIVSAAREEREEREAALAREQQTNERVAEVLSRTDRTP